MTHDDPALDDDHDADPYDQLLRAGICRKCGKPCTWNDPDYPTAFIIPKADRADREPVLRPEGHERGKRFSTHPTVKPVDLMRHLVRLVTPPGGTVLDPFLGSGSTAIACELEGFPWVGIEKEPEYVAIAEARLNGTQRGLGLDVPAAARRA